MGSQCRSGGLQGRHTCSVPRVRGMVSEHGISWDHSVVAAAFKAATLARCRGFRGMVSEHGISQLRTLRAARSFNVFLPPCPLPAVASNQRYLWYYPDTGTVFLILLQPSSLFSAAKATGFPGGFHRARSAAGWLNREDTGAGNPAAEQRFHIISTQAFPCFHKKREPLFRMTLTVIRRRPTLPGRFQPSTISVLRLNFCVRDGNRWIPQAIVTGNLFEVRRFRSLPLGCSRTLKTAQVRVIPPA